MHVIIDRFENGYAVCEINKNKFINVERTLISPDAREGDILIVCNGRFVPDKDATEKRRILIEDKLSALFSEDKN